MKTIRKFLRSSLATSAAIAATLLAVAGSVGAVAGDEARVVESDTHRFEEVSAGVWLATGSGEVFTMSNSMVLVGESDALVVDSHVTPAAARALLESLVAITDKPVRYLVNTHYHFDHAHGNHAFPSGVEIIGHEFTRAKLSGEGGSVLEEDTYRSFQNLVTADIAVTKGELVPPNITLEHKLTLFQATANGSREIRLLHLGRAHTGGDVVVLLPQERIVFTGDMMLPGLAYMGDGHVDEWPQALEQLKSLDFEVWLPGHGPVMRDRAPIDHFQAYLQDLWTRTVALHEQGLSAEDAAEQIDMTDHSDNYPQLSSPGADPRAIRRIYQLLEQ